MEKRRNEGTVCWWQTGCIVEASDLALEPGNYPIHRGLDGALGQDAAESLGAGLKFLEVSNKMLLKASGEK